MDELFEIFCCKSSILGLKIAILKFLQEIWWFHSLLINSYEAKEIVVASQKKKLFNLSKYQEME